MPGFRLEKQSHEDYVFSYGWDCEQVSQETQCSVEEEKSMDQTMLNWIFWSIVGVVFIAVSYTHLTLPTTPYV